MSASERIPLILIPGGLFAHGNARLDIEDVYKILSLKGKLSQREVAKIFNVGRSTIRDIWSGRTWKKLRTQ